MEKSLIVDLIIILLITTSIGVSFMGFMQRLEKKEYFMCGFHLSGLIAFSTLIILFIINQFNNN